MAEPAPATTAFDESVVFLSHFRDLKDPRQQAKVAYPLEEILLLCLLRAPNSWAPLKIPFPFGLASDSVFFPHGPRIRDDPARFL